MMKGEAAGRARVGKKKRGIHLRGGGGGIEKKRQQREKGDSGESVRTKEKRRSKKKLGERKRVRQISKAGASERWRWQIQDRKKNQLYIPYRRYLKDAGYPTVTKRK